MNRHCAIILTLVCTLLLTVFALAGCGGGSGQVYVFSFTMDSVNVGDKYHIDVAVPLGYYSDATTRYDTVYLTDGNSNFNPVMNSVNSLVDQGKMMPVILVGICPIEALQSGYDGLSPYRMRDMFPTFDPAYPGSGHCDKFALFIKDELIPYIDAHYRTNSIREGRCIMGHSAGGFFTWYMLFHYNDTFSKYVPASASLWWDHRIGNIYEADYAATHTDFPAQIYSTVGGAEDPVDMISSRTDLLTRLNSRGYPSLHIQVITYDGLDHLQTIYPSFRDGLMALY